MLTDVAGISCAPQVNPAVRRMLLQANLVAVETIHQRIKRLREAKGLSQQALGDAARVTYQAVQDWERNTAPARKRLSAVAKALDVSEQYLLSGELVVADVAREQTAEYDRLSSKAIDIAYRFDRLSAACQEHVSNQIDLLARVKNDGARARAAQHDVEIKGAGVTHRSKAKKARRT